MPVVQHVSLFVGRRMERMRFGNLCFGLALALAVLTIGHGSASAKVEVSIAAEGVLLVDGVRSETITGLEQGELLMGEVPPGTKLRLQIDETEAPLQVSGGGQFVVGFDRNAGPQASLQAELPGGEIVSWDISIAQREYRIQRIEGVPPKTVSPPPEDAERIEREWLQKRDAKKRDTPQTWFAT